MGLLEDASRLMAEFNARKNGHNHPAPGYTQSPPEIAQIKPDNLVEPVYANTAPPETPPIGRRIRPEEIAALVAFLLSDDAAAITGQEISICGGASL